jgi:hypothetical protein
VGLPLMEVRDKYLQEQLLFENYMSFVQQQQLLMSNASGGGGPDNQYVEDGYIENGYFV